MEIRFMIGVMALALILMFAKEGGSFDAEYDGASVSVQGAPQPVPAPAPVPQPEPTP